MRVAFDARPLTNPHGVGRYARCLLRALHDTRAEADAVLETLRPSSHARSRGADIYHAPWMSGAMLHSPWPMVVTIHGLSALQRRSERLRAGSLRGRLRRLAVQRAAEVIVPTHAVAGEAVAALGLDRERVNVVAEAADEAMYPRTEQQIAAVRERLGLPREYLVWVGGLQHPDPSRHVTELAAATRDVPLVLVGSTRPWAHELPNVTLTGRVTDEQLAAIYSGAHALVLPSEGEGFGLPAVEALACGTPVVAFDSPALREVLSGRAELVPRGDMEALIARAQTARRPAPAPPSWSWQDAARATWSVYASALARTQLVRGTSPQRLRGPAGLPRAVEGFEPEPQ